MKTPKGFNLSTIAMIAAGVAAGVWAINRFTDSGLASFGKAPPAGSK